jgi:hypothetical protein
VDGKRDLKRKLLRNKSEEKDIVSEAGTIASIQLIAKIDLVHIDIELTIVIAIRIEAVQIVEIIIYFTASLSATKYQKLCCILFWT